MFWIFALDVFFQALVPATDAYSCINSSKSEFKLSCNDNGKIVDVNIISATGKCEQSLCTGYTPQLIIQKLSCYGKNKCTIDLPKDIIIQSLDDSSKCIGNKPDVLVLYSWKCTKQGVKIDDFPNKTDSNTGILRSHSRFPWDYFFHDICTDCKGFTYSGTVTFWLKPKDTLVISVDNVNVTDPDNLTWYTKQDTTPRPVSMGTMHFDDSAEAIYLQLNLSKESNGNSGFLICYKYASNGGTIRNACSDLTTTHDKIQKCNRGRKTKKPTGDKNKKCKNRRVKKDKKKTESTTRG